MKPQITQDQAREYVARYRTMSVIEREEMRRATPEEKLKRLSTLMQWVRDFGWAKALAEGEEEVRERWMRLKNHYAA